ncbi:conserved hypothetical protein [Beutenbergia cavernae DSM 12333]|uniref:Uncharacterized protein n=1 Tax=Beutenbergia cavernae (strain ATCC BAA-8 / DSM 12333 / CCUG 43141 / JCM 11478 / NBRC 16432 / NCIMB 13614 / HKI 0122) TaxID=471853 RepID=C5BZ02_BEUC1|nr:hypothetical protein [Beutenbergia cavernae]ACQ81117.1 conserved hypothetical protein [Beutenbergia cavernae DSM 12333]
MSTNHGLPPVELSAGRVVRGWVVRLATCLAALGASFATVPQLGELVLLALAIAVIAVRPGSGITGVWLAGLGIVLLRDPEILAPPLLAALVLGAHATHYLARFAGVGPRAAVQLAALRVDLPVALAAQATIQVLAFLAGALARAEAPGQAAWFALAGVLALLGVTALLLPPLVRAARG